MSEDPRNSSDESKEVRRLIDFRLLALERTTENLEARQRDTEASLVHVKDKLEHIDECLDRRMDEVSNKIDEKHDAIEGRLDDQDALAERRAADARGTKRTVIVTGVGVILTILGTHFLK